MVKSLSARIRLGIAASALVWVHCTEDPTFRAPSSSGGSGGSNTGGTTGEIPQGGHVDPGTPGGSTSSAGATGDQGMGGSGTAGTTPDGPAGGEAGSAGTTGGGGVGGTTKPCEPFGAGELSKAFPADGFSGYTRTFMADKTGYVEVAYQKDSLSLTVAMIYAPEKAEEYANLPGTLNGYPYKTFGQNKSYVFTGCILVSAFGTSDETKRKELLQAVHFSLLP